MLDKIFKYMSTINYNVYLPIAYKFESELKYIRMFEIIRIYKLSHSKNISN